MKKISVIQAALFYKVTNRTVQRWIASAGIKSENGLYDFETLQEVYRNLPHRKR